MRASFSPLQLTNSDDEMSAGSLEAEAEDALRGH